MESLCDVSGSSKHTDIPCFSSSPSTANSKFTEVVRLPLISHTRVDFPPPKSTNCSEQAEPSHVSLSGNPVAYRAVGGRLSNRKAASACASSAAEARVPLWEDLAAVGGTVGGGLRRDRQALPFANGSFQVVPSPALKFHGHQQLLRKKKRKTKTRLIARSVMRMLDKRMPWCLFHPLIHSSSCC